MKEKISRISVIKIPNIDMIISNLKNLIININIIIRLSNKLNIETFDEFKPEELSFETFEKLNITLEKLLTNIDINPVADSKVVEERPNERGTLESKEDSVKAVAESKEDSVKAVAESKVIKEPNIVLVPNVEARPKEGGTIESTKEQVNSAILLVASESKDANLKAVEETKEGLKIDNYIIYCFYCCCCFYFWFFNFFFRHII